MHRLSTSSFLNGQNKWLIYISNYSSRLTQRNISDNNTLFIKPNCWLGVIWNEVIVLVCYNHHEFYTLCNSINRIINSNILDKIRVHVFFFYFFIIWCSSMGSPTFPPVPNVSYQCSQILEQIFLNKTYSRHWKFSLVM